MATHGTTGDTSPTTRRSRRPPSKPRRDLALAMFDLPSEPMETVVSGTSGRLDPSAGMATRQQWLDGAVGVWTVINLRRAPWTARRQGKRHPLAHGVEPEPHGPAR